jgi:hypothetical protein
VRVYLDDEGYLSRDGSRDISLWATDDPDGNPVNWQWRVAFSLNHEGHDVYHAPFNFELPAGTTVDLTVVAPLATPSPGTIIIQGPQGEPGPPGPSALGLIEAKGDLVAGIGNDAATVIPVGAVGEFLTPNPAEPTGLEWQPLPVPEAGLKEYPDRAAVDAVRVAEVGVWHVPNMAVEFAHLIGANPGIFDGTGPADLVVTSNITDHPLNSGPYATRHIIEQSIPLIYGGVILHRTWQFEPPDGPILVGSYTWAVKVEPPLPEATNQTLISIAGVAPNPYDWGLTGLTAYQNPLTAMYRDVNGRSSVASPDPTTPDPNSIVNVATLDAAIAAIPPATGGGLKVYATLADLELVRTAEVGTLHVDNLAAAFPTLAASHPGAFAGTGPADLLILSSMADHSDADPSDFALVLQTFTVPSSAVPLYVDVFRRIYFYKSTGVMTQVEPWTARAAIPAAGAMKVYPNVAALDAIRAAEIGRLSVPDLAAAFPTLAGTFPTLFLPGPADLLITTTMNPGNVDYGVKSFLQRFELAYPDEYLGVKRFWRNMQIWGNSGWNGPPFIWNPDAQLPAFPSQGMRSTVTDNATQGWIVGPYVGVSELNFGSIALRDGAGRSQFATPVAATDAANKKYVDDAIAAAIAALP